MVDPAPSIPSGCTSGRTSGRTPAPSAWLAATTPVVRTEVAPGLVFASTVRRFAAYLVDILIYGIVGYVLAFLIALIAVVIVGGGSAEARGGLAGVVYAVVFTGITFAYFVGTWRSRARATPGMRLFKLQVGNAVDGRTLTLDQATRRWTAMGYPLTLVAVIPALGGLAGLVEFVLVIVLLVTTIASATKQGLHDRFAGSFVVQPTGLGIGSAVGCILAWVLLLFIIPIVAVVALFYLGGQVTHILSTVGTPAP